MQFIFFFCKQKNNQHNYEIFSNSTVPRIPPGLGWCIGHVGWLWALHGSRGLKIASKLLQVGFLEPIWAQLGAKLAPSWLKLGSCWAQVGSKLAQVGPCWLQVGYL